MISSGWGGSTQFVNVIMVVIKRTLSSILLLLAVAANLRGDFEPAQWKYFKPIHFNGTQSRQLIAVPLDADVFSHSRSLEKELRVIEGMDSEVPFNLVVDSDREITDKHIEIVDVNRRKIDHRYQELVCDLGFSGQIANEIELKVPDKNFVRRAEVDGSDDKVRWISVARRLHLFDWSEGRLVNLEFPDSAFRFLRVRLWLDGGRPLTIQEITVARHKRHKGELQAVEAKLKSHSLNGTEKFSEWVFDFGSDHPLVNRCDLEVINVNFRRRVSLATSDNDTVWLAGPGLEIFRTTSDEGRDEFTSLETSALNHRFLRIRIFNRNERPLTVGGIHFQRFARRVVFEYDPAKSYRLFYGSPDAHQPSYDLSAIESRSRLTTLPEARLDAQHSNPEYVNPGDQPLPPSWHRPLLWAALAVVLLILGAALLRMRRRRTIG